MPAARTRSDASRSRRADRAAAPPESRYPIEDTAPEACPCPGGCATPLKSTASGATRVPDDFRRTLTEYSETRVAALWAQSGRLGLHPVYRYAMGVRDDAPPPESALATTAAHPMGNLSDYVPSEQGPEALPKIIDIEKGTIDIVRAMGRAIAPGNAQASAFEEWVDDALRLCFPENLLNTRSQTIAGRKKFEHVYELSGAEFPWNEFRIRARFPRVYVECKNRREAEIDTADVAKTVRDMDALDLGLAFLVYNEDSREPRAALLQRLRAVYNESKRAKVIIGVPSGLLFALIDRGGPGTRRTLFGNFWRSYIEKWLAAD